MRRNLVESLILSFVLWSSVQSLHAAATETIYSPDCTLPVPMPDPPPGTKWQMVEQPMGGCVIQSMSADEPWPRWGFGWGCVRPGGQPGVAPRPRRVRVHNSWDPGYERRPKRVHGPL